MAIKYFVVISIYCIVGYAATTSVLKHKQTEGRPLLTSSKTKSCPCTSPVLCNPITKTTPFEVFAFATSQTNYINYDWTRITTVVLFANAKENADKMMCYAHSKGVRVSFAVDYPVNNLTDANSRRAWTKSQVQFAEDHFLDGVNFDFEAGLRASDKERREGLNLLVDELTASFKSYLSKGQVTFDAVSNPPGGRHYDYLHIASKMDFILIMAYDESGECRVGANADFITTVNGVKNFQAEGIPADKLVLGLPWYGYDYPCSTIIKDKCTILTKCGGIQVSYEEIIYKLLPTNTSGRLWDDAAVSPYFNREVTKGGLHQTWYDDKQSLSAKYKWAHGYGLRGVGIWNADLIDYTDTPGGKKQQNDMWGALPIVNEKHYIKKNDDNRI